MTRRQRYAQQMTASRLRGGLPEIMARGEGRIVFGGREGRVAQLPYGGGGGDAVELLVGLVRVATITAIAIHPTLNDR